MRVHRSYKMNLVILFCCVGGTIGSIIYCRSLPTAAFVVLLGVYALLIVSTLYDMFRSKDESVKKK